jgi:AcrR family transcriptional regulator
MDEHPNRAEHILDAALLLGERDSWDAVHLHDVAQQMGIALTEVYRHYRQKDDLAEAWFDRADLALIRAGEAPEWNCLPIRERLLRTILAWFDALAARRELSIQMLRYKLQPDHLHLQAAGLLRISRTVQWIRETARLPTVGWRREVEEVVLTGIFLGAVGFGSWIDRPTPAAHAPGSSAGSLPPSAWPCDFPTVFDRGYPHACSDGRARGALGTASAARLSPRSRLLLGGLAAAFPDVDFIGFLVDPLRFLAYWHQGRRTRTVLPLGSADRCRLLRHDRRWRRSPKRRGLQRGTGDPLGARRDHGLRHAAALPLSDWRVSLGTTFVIDPLFTA